MKWGCSSGGVGEGGQASALCLAGGGCGVMIHGLEGSDGIGVQCDDMRGGGNKSSGKEQVCVWECCVGFYIVFVATSYTLFHVFQQTKTDFNTEYVFGNKYCRFT